MRHGTVRRQMRRWRCTSIQQQTGAYGKKAYKGASNIKEKANGCVKGVTGSTVAITHTATSDKIGNVYIVPGASANLLSVPTLMRQGCTMGAKGTDLWVTDIRGNTKFRARLNSNGMYVVKLKDIRESEDGETLDMERQTKRKISALIAGGNTMFWQGNRMWVRDKDNVYTYSTTTDSDAVYATVGKAVNRQRGQICTDKVMACSAELDTNRSFTTEERERAVRARRLHACQGHPSSHVLKLALDNALLDSEESLTGRDVDNADAIFGPCEACTEAKMTAPIEPQSQSSPANRVGEVLYADLHALTKDKRSSLGGHRQWLIGRDEKSGMPYAVGMTSKTQKCVCDALDSVIAYYNQYGHKVSKYVFDNEAVFISCGDHLRRKGVEPVYTPSGMHNKRAERLVRELKDKMRCIECALPYELPDELYGEKLSAAVEAIGSLPNTNTGATTTPYLMVTGRRPRPRRHAFGQPGLCHSRRGDTPDQRTEWCVYLSSNEERDHRVYIPFRQLV